MRNRWSFAVMAVALTAAAGIAQVALAWPWERLDLSVLDVRQKLRGAMVNTARSNPGNQRLELALRQQLRNEVQMAMTDGRLDNEERLWILADARKNLPREEYPGFETWLGRLSAPTAPMVSSQPLTSERQATWNQPSTSERPATPERQTILDRHTTWFQPMTSERPAASTQPTAVEQPMVPRHQHPQRSGEPSTVTIKPAPPRPTIPTGAARPERMAWTGKAW